MTLHPLVARGWRTLSLVTLAVLVVALGSLLAQHLRRGWPFSLHHGMAPANPPGGHVAAAPPALDGTEAVDPHAAHTVPGRVPVAVPRGQLDAIGVRIARVAREDIGRPVRAVATVALDESRVSHVHTRVAGW
ncbi:MAG: hypothetical protein Q8S73_35035, partial [Deltaproteobacteria bacterium]|nr:hypothetical protein [Deltaproteobacteria bacterium]